MPKGRKPKPAELRAKEGKRGHRPIPKTVKPKKARFCPKPPAWLLDDAKDEWKRVSQELFELDLLKGVDEIALAGYCQTFAKWKDAEERLEGEELTFITEKGYMGLNPLANLSIKYSKEMRAYMVEFGMTPSSRSRIAVDKSDEGDDWDKFLN